MFIIRQRRLPFVILLLTIVLIVIVGLVQALVQVAELNLHIAEEEGEAYELFRDKNGNL